MGAKTLLFLAWLIRKLLADCGPGCLQCRKPDYKICNFCDITNNYFQTNGTCVQNLTLTNNCSIFGQNGKCVKCGTGRYMDEKTETCRLVPIKNQIQNCDLYDSQLYCIDCLPNYYLSIQTCLPLQIFIKDCAYYVRDGVCKRCAVGFMTTADRSSCIPISPSKLCLTYSFIRCRTCAVGYNQYINAVALNMYNSTFLSFILSLDPNFGTIGKLDACQPVTTDPNCASLDSSSNCLTCNQGFFLSPFGCTPQPATGIGNCTVYSSVNNCTCCASGFYVASDTSCAPVANISNCLIYDSCRRTTVCLQCKDDYYLVQSQMCVSRVASSQIQNCANLSNTSDVCQNCIDGFNVTTDGLACLPTIVNCTVYARSTMIQTALLCQVCSPGYVPNQATSGADCIPGTIQNCEVYSVSLNCLKCSKNYYLTNNICQLVTPVLNCDNYDPTTPNLCTSCQQGSILLGLSTTCQAQPVISNCLTYDLTGLSCLSCAFGFYLFLNGCATIPNLVPNCIKYQLSTCVACSSGYMVSTLGTLNTCVQLPDYVTANCDSYSPDSSQPYMWSLNSTNSIKCLSCISNSIAIQPTLSEGICVSVSQNYLQSNSFSFTGVNGCYRFGLTNTLTPTLVCMECQTGSFLTGYWLTNGAPGAPTGCTTSCSTTNGMNVLIPDDLIGFVNICVPANGAVNGIPGTACSVMARYTTVNNGTIADYTCVTAAFGYVLSFAIPSTFVYSLDIPGSLTPKVMSQLNDAGHGMIESDPTFTISVFNYRGITTMSSIPTTNLWGSPVPNCEIAWVPGQKGTRGAVTPPLQIPANQALCLRCKFGSHKVVVMNQATNSIPTCQPQTLCISSIRLGGLPSFLNALFGCHVCQSSITQANYPTVYLEYGVQTTVQSLNVIFQLMIDNSTNSIGFDCAPPPSMIVAASTDLMTGSMSSAAFTLKNSCAMFGTIRPIVSPNTGGTVISVCLACKSGSYPSYSRFNTTGNLMPYWAVSSCTTIQNCDTTIQNGPFNSCSACLVSLQLTQQQQSYAFTDFSLSNCQVASTLNCFILNSTVFASTSLPNACGVCASGYFLNYDNICEILTIPNMGHSAKFIRSYYAAWIAKQSFPFNVQSEALIVRVQNLLNFYGIGYGLRSPDGIPCNSGYIVSAPFSLARQLCVLSDYLSNPQTLPSNTQYIQNCISYNATIIQPSNQLFVNGNMIPCARCSLGYIPTSNGLACVKELTNCRFTFPKPFESICYFCLDGFFNVDGKCITGIITHCSKYINTQGTHDMKFLKCDQCSPGYYLTLDKMQCNFGSVSNCSTYYTGSPTYCLSCVSGYSLFSSVNYTFTCLLNDPNSNCQNFTISKQISNVGSIVKMQCQQCVQNATAVFGLLVNTASVANKNMCLAFALINNCILYDQTGPNAQNLTFKCLSCENGYWLSQSNNTCVQRTVNLTTCISYANNSDTCLLCGNGTYLNSNGTSCIRNPTGIPGCQVYLSLFECSVCAPPFYLLYDGSCARSTKIISNCTAYSDDSACSACDRGYFLMNHTSCLPTKALNCLKAASETECYSCDQNYGLASFKGVKSCLPVFVPNCVTWKPVYPFPCQTCQSGYYPDANGECQKVSTTILNCQIYDSSSTCVLCSNSSVLSADRTVCNNTYYKDQLDSNCADQYLGTESYCTQCPFGQYLKDGVCVQCRNQTLENGCLICSAFNQSECVLCSPGYYQNQTGNCQPLDPTGNITNQSTNMTVVSSTTILTTLSFMFIMTVILTAF